MERSCEGYDNERSESGFEEKNYETDLFKKPKDDSRKKIDTLERTGQKNLKEFPKYSFGIDKINE